MNDYSGEFAQERIDDEKEATPVLGGCRRLGIDVILATGGILGAIDVSQLPAGTYSTDPMRLLFDGVMMAYGAHAALSLAGRARAIASR